VPGLALGGCVSRFVQLAVLPLALAVGWAADRGLAAGTRGHLLVFAATAVLAVEYAPVAPGVQPWPDDPAMAAIAAAPGPGTVLDLDPGVGALVRQLEHGRPQTLGYLSRTPEPQWRRRLADPVLGPLLGAGPVDAAPPAAVAAAWLRHRWGVRWVVAAPGSEPAQGDAPLARAGVLLEGVFAPETVTVAGRTVRGRWTGAEARVLVPARPGRLVLTVAAPRPGTPRLAVSWPGARRELEVAGVVEVTLEVPAAALCGDGTFVLGLHAEAFQPQHDARELGVFLVTLAAKPHLPAS